MAQGGWTFQSLDSVIGFQELEDSVTGLNFYFLANILNLFFHTRAFMPAVAESNSRLTLDSATPPKGFAQNDEVGILMLKNQNLFDESKKLRSCEYSS